MSKRSRERRRAAKLMADIPGGLVGAIARNQNGSATPRDIDFLSRMREEYRGRNGYTGESKGASTAIVPSGQRKDSYTFNTSYHSPVRDPGVFHCAEAAEVTDKCPLNPKVPSIFIDTAVWRAFLDCAKIYDTEWIALLIGKLDKEENGDPAYIISKFYFPPQVASGAHVEVPTGVKPKPGTIGAIHSHVEMSVFWSATDKAHSNWPVEIVINRREEYKALSRFQLKCGEWAKGDSKVYITGDGLSKGVRSQVEQAFVEGERLLTKSSKVSTTANLANLASEDAADVMAAGWSQCPNDWQGAAGKYPCIRPRGHEGLCQTLTGVHWLARGIVTPSATIPTIPTIPSNGSSGSKTEEFCGYKRGDKVCIREKDHAGWHKHAPVANVKETDCYFQDVPVSATPDMAKDTPSLPWPDKEPSITIPLSPLTETSEIPDDLGEEDYCEVCEGTSFVEVNGIVVPCQECKDHPGLSQIGAVRAREDGWLH